MNFLTKLIAVLVLAGVINAVVIEPAVCLMHEDAASQQEESSDCCSACHPIHSQGILPSGLTDIFAVLHADNFMPIPQISFSDSPAQTIFRPPLVF